MHNAPGDDIAVVMCGYEDRIRKMLLDQNDGLQRRFPIASAFVFEDFSDEELRQIMVKKRGVRAPRTNAVARGARKRVPLERPPPSRRAAPAWPRVPGAWRGL